MASFRDGFKINDAGQQVRPVKFLERQSSSSPTLYTATLWADGTASCNCPGWTRRIAAGHRACTHSKELNPAKPWIEESDTRAAEKARGVQIQKNRDTVTRLQVPAAPPRIERSPDRFILVRDQKVAAPKPERARPTFDEEV